MTLSTVLQKLKEAGLVLNEKKFNFRQTSLRFLGHTINAKGILPDQEHLDAVRNAPPSSDAASLQSFLRLVLWCSKFLPGFATVVAPMRECVRKKDCWLGLLLLKIALRTLNGCLCLVLPLPFTTPHFIQ